MDNGRELDFQGTHRITYLVVASGRDHFRFACEFREAKMLGLKSPWLYFRTQIGTIRLQVYLIILMGLHMVLPKDGR